ncbi:molybdopterin molybdotransferase MoeA [Sunxiuqinia sp. A32]|uniref:molybdopterin molybdotransferase MoeA n=1 Tax=Sunxiuqinia sp. A32 TaxID=3461496 RepID=UPI0040465A27
MEHPEMINLQEALDIAFSKAHPTSTEKIDFRQSAGKVLAKDVFSDMNMPPFNKSAMDGYACKKEDLEKVLDLLEIIPAGKAPTQTIHSGQCSKIMTGAKVPEGADTIFMVEQSEKIAPNKIRFTGNKTNSNICLLGEDLLKGDLVLPAGTLLKAQHIAMLAAVGCTQPELYMQPKVGIISTGSELVEPDTLPQTSQIRNSNGHQMVVQTENCNCQAAYYGIVKDDEQSTYETIKKSIKANDVTLISGGVSVGDFDYVPLVIKNLDFEILFNKLTVKPGKHTTFAVKENKYIIGLPGNPVSSFIQFEIFVKPFLYKLMGFDWKSPSLPLPLAQNFQRRKSDREEFVPVSINDQNEVVLISYHGSAHIHAYNQSFGFMNIPQGINQIKKGETVYVRPL